MKITGAGEIEGVVMGEAYCIELECGVENPEELTVGSYARVVRARRREHDRGALAEVAEKSEEPAKPSRTDADKAAIAQRMADGSSLEAATSAVRPDVSVLELLGL